MERMTIAKAIKYYKDNNRFTQLAESTIATYDIEIDLFYHFVKVHLRGIRAVQDIKPTHLYQYKAFIESDSVAIKTLKKKLAVVKLLFKLLKRHGILDNNPADIAYSGLRFVEKKVIKDCLDLEEINEIIERATLDGVDRQTLCLFSCLAFLGTRRSEICNLKWSAINFKDRTVKIDREKNRTTDIVAIHSLLYKALYEYYSECRPADEEFVFGVKRKKRMTVAHYTELFRSFMHYAGYDENMKLTGHSFRHGFCTMMVKKGASLSDIAIYTGHKSLESLSNYIHLDIESLRSAQTALN